MDFTGSRITVIGAGVSGRAVAGWLVSEGARVVLSDAKPLGAWPGDLVSWCREHGVETEAGGHSPECLSGADMVVASPGVSPASAILARAAECGVPVVGELYLGLSMWPGPVIGITGTNGKTTTTSLVAWMLRTSGVEAAALGNIGTPVCGLIGRVSTETVAVAEVSSFQLDYFPDTGPAGLERPRFNGVAWLNLAPDHLDRYGTFSAYGRSKARILNFQSEEDWAVFNAHDSASNRWTDVSRATKFFFGKGKGTVPGAWHLDGGIEFAGHDGSLETYTLDRWSLVGEHNLENLCAAIPLARRCGASREGIQRAIDSFVPPAHRISLVARVGGVSYYDDSKATNVASVIRALSSVPGPKILIAGGRGKGEDYQPLAAEAARSGVKAAIVFGEEAGRMGEVLEPVTRVFFLSMNGNGGEIVREAVERAQNMAESGDSVLLSPACASFDLFENYQERGRAFASAVLDLEDR